MLEFWTILQQTPLFTGITEDKADRMLTCLSAARRSFAKGMYILHTGDAVTRFGLILTGSVQVVAEDFWGNRNILAILGVGEVFAESYACLPGAKLTVDVMALEDTEALFLDARNALMPCASACDEHGALVRNLAAMLAAKNLNLNDKLHHVTQRSTREKLLSYLSAQSARTGSPTFAIPFNRQQLADYLAVERSAMSAELGRLRDEGVLTFQKNGFCLRV
jgi:CRP/FNR family transcriptional regulator, dissimilatory nitrate respiration regulator